MDSIFSRWRWWRRRRTSRRLATEARDQYLQRPTHYDACQQLVLPRELYRSILFHDVRLTIDYQHRDLRA
jgi:hypothetical protein